MYKLNQLECFISLTRFLYFHKEYLNLFDQQFSNQKEKNVNKKNQTYLLRVNLSNFQKKPLLIATFSSRQAFFHLNFKFLTFVKKHFFQRFRYRHPQEVLDFQFSLTMDINEATAGNSWTQTLQKKSWKTDPLLFDRQRKTFCYCYSS